jgi:hypothetical protein
MYEIINRKDLEKFKENNPYPEIFSDYLEARFDELERCLEDHFDGEGEFNLKEFGHLVVLSPSADNLSDLNEVGLNPEGNGLWGAIPEVVEEIIMPGFIAYQISIVYTNSYMMIFYLTKDEVKDLPEFQKYLATHSLSTIYFQPKGKWQSSESEQKWKFNGKKYITQGVDIFIPIFVQISIWNYIEERKQQNEISLDYLQVFNLYQIRKDGKFYQVIECSQEQPPFKKVLKIPADFTVKEKIFVIDDVDHQTMLLAREY